LRQISKLGKLEPKSERETLDRIRETLPNLLQGLTVERVLTGRKERGNSPDLVARLRIGGKEKLLAIEVKRVAEPRIAQQAIYALLQFKTKSKGFYPVLAAFYIPESTRKLCRTAGVGYVDLLGNAFLRFDGVFIDRTTSETPRIEQKYARSLAPPKTSRVVRTLLKEPKRLFRLTELANESGVSQAQAYKVAGLLETRGYVRRSEGKLVRLTDPRGLLEAWSGASDFNKNRIFRAFSLEKTPEAIMRDVAKASRRVKLGYAFTMFAGASLLAPFVRFYDVAVYVEGDPGRWLNGLGAKVVDSGSNLQLVTPRDDNLFKEYQTISGLRVVPTVQLYADLFNNASRGREQAEHLRETVLKF